jgi:uncharacterized MnhB-related membrane protein
MTGFTILGTFFAMILIAFTLVIQKRLADSIILFMGLGLASVALFFIFQAPDVALTEVVIGAGIGTLIFLIALKHFKAKA